MIEKGERRRLVFENLVNGLSIQQVMVALQLSERDVQSDFDFVVQKLRAYRFLRLMPILDIDTIDKARASRVDVLYTLGRIDTDKDPLVRKVTVLPYMPTGMSPAEQVMIELQSRRNAK